MVGCARVRTLLWNCGAALAEGPPTLEGEEQPASRPERRRAAATGARTLRIAGPAPGGAVKRCVRPLLDSACAAHFGPGRARITPRRAEPRGRGRRGRARATG